MATVVVEPPDEQGLRSGLGIALGRCVAGKDLLRFIENDLVDDRRMLASITRLAMVDLAEIHPVLEKGRPAAHW